MRDFDHTVNVLVQAYLKDELAHMVCGACAVGNIVAAAIGTKPKRIEGVTVFDNVQFEDGTLTLWYNTIVCESTSGIGQIMKTGYTVDELRQIEQAFENAPGKPDGDGLFDGKTTDPVWMFNGLMAVVDVLAEIHGIDLKQREEAKLLFTK